MHKSTPSTLKELMYQDIKNRHNITQSQLTSYNFFCFEIPFLTTTLEATLIVRDVNTSVVCRWTYHFNKKNQIINHEIDDRGENKKDIWLQRPMIFSEKEKNIVVELKDILKKQKDHSHLFSKVFGLEHSNFCIEIVVQEDGFRLILRPRLKNNIIGDFYIHKTSGEITINTPLTTKF